MKITVEEFEKNLEYYLEKASEEEITITRDGVAISSLISPEQYEKYTGKKDQKRYLKTRLCLVIFTGRNDQI